jgi:hypothetical protein
MKTGVFKSKCTDGVSQIRSCRGGSAAEDQQDQQSIQQDDRGGSQPGERGDPPGIGELAHPAFISRELHQRNKRERQLKTQNDLAEDEQAHGLEARVLPARLAAGLADDAPVEITACIRRSAIA